MLKINFGFKYLIYEKKKKKMLTLTFSIFRLTQNTSMNVFLSWLKYFFNFF